MIIKPRVTKKCSGECGSFVTVSEPVYGCHNCQKEISSEEREHHCLRLTIFYKRDSIENEDREYCSWKCCIEDLQKQTHEGVNFITLPYLTFDRDLSYKLQFRGFADEVFK